MERTEQEISEEGNEIRSDECGSDADAFVLSGKEGHRPVSGGGKRDEDGEGFYDEIDLSTLNPRLRARFERLSDSERRLGAEQKAKIKEIVRAGRVLFDEPMASHSTMGAGGNAECFVIVEELSELTELVKWAVDGNVDYRFIGNASNILVRDGGCRGLLIKLGSKFDNVEVSREDGGDVYVSVGAAMQTQKFVRWAIKEGLAGTEVIAGIPGTIGGNLVTNAGTKAGWMESLVSEVTIVTKDGRELSMKRSALRFEYRSLKIPRTSVVTRAILKLKKSSEEDAGKLVNDVMQKRSGSQPLSEKSLGCIFKNPGKTPAGMLIEDSGLKNVRVGGARVSKVHANFIVNEGKATARDITVLLNLIRERVREATGMQLETEIEIIGDECK